MFIDNHVLRQPCGHLKPLRRAPPLPKEVPMMLCTIPLTRQAAETEDRATATPSMPAPGRATNRTLKLTRLTRWQALPAERAQVASRVARLQVVPERRGGAALRCGGNTAPYCRVVTLEISTSWRRPARPRCDRHPSRLHGSPCASVALGAERTVNHDARHPSHRRPDPLAS